MKREETALKLTALRGSVNSWLKDAHSFYLDPRDTQDLFVRFNKIRDALKSSYKSLFEDLPDREVPKPSGTTDHDGRGYIRREHFELLLTDIDYCLAILTTNKNQKGEKMPIDKYQIEKITVKDLIMMPLRLTLGAIILLVAIIGPILTFTYYLGYRTGISRSSTTNKQTPSLEQLSNHQISLLKEIYNYQKITGANKVVILKTGLVVDETTNKETSINIAINVLGNRADQTRFEDLIMSMPEFYLKRLPSTRFNDPYVLTVTEETRKLLDKKL